MLSGAGGSLGTQCCGMVPRPSLVQLCFLALLWCWIPLGSVWWVQGMKQEPSPGRDADANPLCPGQAATSPNLSLLSDGLRSGAEHLCHGKSPQEQLWHFTAAPAPGVITLLASCLLSGWDEHPSEPFPREMSQRGPATFSRGLPGMGTVCASTLKPFLWGLAAPWVTAGSAVTWAASRPVRRDVSPKSRMLRGSDRGTGCASAGEGTAGMSKSSNPTEKT